MNKYAMILSGSIVRGVCVWDEIEPWNPPPGVVLVIKLNDNEVAGPGWTYTPEQTPRFSPPSDN